MSYLLDSNDNTELQRADCSSSFDDERYKRDLKSDLTKAIDAIFELRNQLALLHPIAKSLAIRMVSY